MFFFKFVHRSRGLDQDQSISLLCNPQHHFSSKIRGFRVWFCCRLTVTMTEHMTSLCPRSHLYDLQHLIAADIPVAVQVVHAECPLELLLQLAAWRHAQRDDELPEVYRAIGVGVKCAEDVLGKLGGVAVWEEVGVDLLELLHVEVAAGAVLQEALGRGRIEDRRIEERRI